MENSTRSGSQGRNQAVDQPCCSAVQLSRRDPYARNMSRNALAFVPLLPVGASLSAAATTAADVGMQAEPLAQLTVSVSPFPSARVENVGQEEEEALFELRTSTATYFFTSVPDSFRHRSPQKVLPAEWGRPGELARSGSLANGCRREGFLATMVIIWEGKHATAVDSAN